MIPRPTGMQFDDWACAVLDSIPDLRTFPPPIGEQNWKVFAGDLMSDQVFAGKQILDHNSTVRWQEWAESLVYAMENTA